MRKKASSTTLEGLNAVLQSVLDAVIIIDSQGCVIGWSETATQTFGWTTVEATGQSLSDLIIPQEYRESHQAGMLRYQRTGEARVINKRLEIAAVDKSGRKFPVELAIVEAAHEGKVIFIGFLRDISDRRAIEQKLSFSEESLRLATEAAEVGTWDLDLLTNTLFWSGRTKSMFGISADKVCTMSDFYNGLHPEDEPLVRVAFESALNPNLRSVYDVQYRTIGKEDGLIRWVSAKGKGLFNESGECVRAVGTAIDITLRKRAEARGLFMLQLNDLLGAADTEKGLKEVCAIIGSYFTVSRVGYGHLDPVEDYFDYSVCWTDETVPPLIGRFPAHAFGTKIVQKLSAGETVVIADLFDDPLTLNEDHTKTTAANVSTRAILVVPFLRAGRLRTIIYLNDRHIRAWTEDEITFMKEVAERTRQVVDRTEAESALQALNATLEARVEERSRELSLMEDALRQSQKMETLGQLTGGIAHDFNNFLQGISGNLEVMNHLIERGRTDGLGKYIVSAMESSKSAAALIQRLLAFARRQPLAPGPVDINERLLSMEGLLRRSLNEKVQFELTLQSDVGAALCDANQLESAVLNLIINARDAMPDGGKLVLVTRSYTETMTRQEGGLKPGNYVSISVQDSGMGMDDATISRAFEPFFTTKPQGSGTGLGLSMIYGFAQQSGGRALIESKLDQGTCVTLFLPKSEEFEATSRGNVRSSCPAGNGESILVVEDDPVVRNVIVSHLGEFGYNVLEAENGAVALEIICSANRIDLLISDIGLPGLNGRHLAYSARIKRPNLKILLITGYEEGKAFMDEALESGMRFMVKPFEMSALVATIHDIISQS